MTNQTISARMAALTVLCETEKKDVFASVVTDALFRRYTIDAREKSLASTLITGVLQNRIFLDYQIAAHYSKPMNTLTAEVLNILRIGAYQICFLTKIPAYSAVDESVKLTRLAGQPSASGLVNAVLRKVSAYKDNPVLPNAENRVKFLSVKYSVPAWIISLWDKNFGDAEKIARGYCEKPKICLRVNTIRTDTDTLLGMLPEGTEKADIRDSVTLAKFPGIASNEAYTGGLFHVQDLSSQICAAASQAKKGDRILDLCAAPGGKSFTVAELMENDGELISCDVAANKVELIRSGADRLGLTCIKPRKNDAAIYDPSLGEFDKVLADVPCSGFGVMRRKPEIRYKSQRDVEYLPELQFKLLSVAAKYVKKGGRLIYSTCTFLPQENSEVRAKFLSENDGFEASGIGVYGIEDTEKTFFPDTDKTDGFYIAAFRRKD